MAKNRYTLLIILFIPRTAVNVRRRVERVESAVCVFCQFVAVTKKVVRLKQQSSIDDDSFIMLPGSLDAVVWPFDEQQFGQKFHENGQHPRGHFVRLRRPEVHVQYDNGDAYTL